MSDGYGVTPGTLTTTAGQWERLEELMSTSQGELAAADSGGFPPSVQGAAATFLAAWAGYAGESGTIASGFAAGAALDADALRPGRPDERGRAEPPRRPAGAGPVTVTIQIPASEPTIRRPQGSPGAVDTVARTLYAAAGRYEEFDELATTARTVPGWYGDAYDAYAAAAGRAAGEHATMAATLRRVAHVCSAHSDTLTDLQRDCDALRDTKVSLDGSRDDLIADVRAAGQATPEEVAALQDRAQTLRTEYLTLVLDHDALQRKVRANEDLMRTAFQGATVLTKILAPGGTVDPLAGGAMARPGAPGTGASATEVAEWWSTLTAAEKEAVIATVPRRHRQRGRAPGATPATRPTGSASTATSTPWRRRRPTAPSRSSRQRILDNARAADRRLDRADTYVDPTTGITPGGQLWLYDPGAFDGDGRVAVAVGDLDTADDVALRVPGITNDGLDAPTLTQEAINVYQSAVYNGDGSTVASMMWLGYDAPDAFYDSATAHRGTSRGRRRPARGLDRRPAGLPPLRQRPPHRHRPQLRLDHGGARRDRPPHRRRRHRARRQPRRGGRHRRRRRPRRGRRPRLGGAQQRGRGRRARRPRVGEPRQRSAAPAWATTPPRTTSARTGSRPRTSPAAAGTVASPSTATTSAPTRSRSTTSDGSWTGRVGT